MTYVYFGAPQAKEKPTEGAVIAAGPGRLHPETAVLMPMPVKAGESPACFMHTRP
jgi:chaperonin GroES